MSEVDRMAVAAFLCDFAAPIGGWQCFHTATFRPAAVTLSDGKTLSRCPARSEWIAMKRYRDFMQERDRRKISWCAAVEPNPDHNALNPGFHIHAIWSDMTAIHRVPSAARWDAQYGNNQIRPVLSSADVQAYVSKYAIKENCMIEWQANGGLWHAHQALQAA